LGINKRFSIGKKLEIFYWEKIRDFLLRKN